MSQATDTSMEGSIMTDLEHLSTQELKAILDETEQRIHEIRAELEEREADTQHTLVESIELSPEWTPVKWGQVKAFFQLVLDELRSKKP
ncbi:MAG TPA: hypothetical protein EYH51_01710 [Pseudomonas pachastrellae]|nr:hypothetical protein [Halopseudomonas pachastrellae]